MKNYNSQNVDKIFDFFIKANATVKSVDWLEERIEQIINELDKFDSGKLKPNPKKEESLIAELRQMLQRAQIEFSAIQNLENEIETYLQEKKPTAKKTKKVKPKNSI